MVKKFFGLENVNLYVKSRLWVYYIVIGKFTQQFFYETFNFQTNSNETNIDEVQKDSSPSIKNLSKIQDFSENCCSQFFIHL